jgi:cytoskeletal protein RodZ
VSENINQMTKLLSRNLLSSIPLGIAIWIAATSPSKANPSNNPQGTATRSTIEPTSLKVTNSLATSVGNAASDEQVNQAREATEIKPGDWAYQNLQALNQIWLW